MIKKMTSLLLVLIMVASAVLGCGSKEEAAVETPEAVEETAETEEAAETTESKPLAGKKVGFTLPSVNNDFMQFVADTVKAGIESAGAECQVDSADGDVTKQIEQIENYEVMEMDLIVVLPINGEALTSVCQKVIEAGTPVIAYAMAIPDGATGSVLAADEYEMGKASAEIASEWIDKTFAEAGAGEVSVYLLSSSYSPELASRCDGMRDTIAGNEKVNLIEEEIADSNSSQEAAAKIENAFLSYPDIDVIIAANAASAVGVESYIASSSSPIEDTSKFGIFTVDQTEEITTKILASANDESTLRGTISMGDIPDLVNNYLVPMCKSILADGETDLVTHGSYSKVTAETLAK